MSSRVRLEITVHIGQTIRVSAIFLFIYRVKKYIFDVACSIYLYLGLRQSVRMKSKKIFRTHFSYKENVEISIRHKSI